MGEKNVCDIILESQKVFNSTINDLMSLPQSVKRDTVIGYTHFVCGAILMANERNLLGGSTRVVDEDDPYTRYNYNEDEEPYYDDDDDTCFYSGDED